VWPFFPEHALVTIVRKPIYTSSPPNDRSLNYTDLDLSYLIHSNEYWLALSLNGWVEGHVWKGFVTEVKGRANSLSDCSLAYIPINNSLSGFQKNLWESVNYTCSIKVSGESLEVIL
jgi:hypothetical protein